MKPAIKKEMDRFLLRIKGANDLERGALVAAATHCRHEFKSLFQTELARVDEESPDLGALELALFQLISAAQANQQWMHASGWMVWLFSVRAISQPGLRFQGHLMWKDLARGFPYVEEAALHAGENGQPLRVTGFEHVPKALQVHG